MKRPAIQQKTERRISAALRLALTAILLLLQIALVLFLSYLLRSRLMFGYVVVQVIAVVCALRIYNRPGGLSYKAGWILLVLALPVVGLILYYLWNGSRPGKRLDLQKRPMPGRSEREEEESARRIEKLRKQYPLWGRLATYLHRQGFPLWSDTQVQYFPTGQAYLEDLLDRAAQAEHFIFLEYYIAGQGKIWTALTDILCRKAAVGVEVKLLFDDFGSMLRLPDEEQERLRAAGIQLRMFNPVHHYVNRLYFNYRDHRKIACIDGDIAYTGGVNLADEYANLVERFGYWKDSGVRLEGKGAWGLTREFIRMWERLGGSFEREHDYYRPVAAAPVESFCQCVSDGPDNNPANTVEDTFLQLIQSGRSMVYITTPYLAIDESMIRALCIAGDSGVDVRLMLPGIPDHKFAYWVAESYFGQLMYHGVKLYRYRPGLLHGKTVMVDREAAFVGTVNMDYRSFQLHFECGVLFYGMPVVEELLEDMDEIMACSDPVTREEWQRRPLRRKVLGSVLRPFAMWM